MSSQSLLDWELLLRWAKSKPEEEALGISCSSMCPISNYLSERVGGYWIVGRTIQETMTNELLSKPNWLSRLLEIMDASTGGMMATVSRERFIDLLDQVKPRTNSDIASNNVEQSWKYEQTLESSLVVKAARRAAGKSRKNGGR